MTQQRQHWFARMVKSHTFTIVIGCLLICTGIIEICETIIPEFETFLGVHHGLIIIGISHVIKALVHLLEGTEAVLITEAVEKIETLDQNISIPVE